MLVKGATGTVPFNHYKSSKSGSFDGIDGYPILKKSCSDRIE